MSFSTNLYSVVKNVMAKGSQTATLVQEQKSTEGSYNPDTGEFTKATATSTTVRVVLIDYALTSNGLQTKSGTLIEANDKQCYMDAKATNGTDISRAVSAVDHLVIDGETWRVMNVKEYNPSGSYTIMYDLMLRKGL